MPLALISVYDKTGLAPFAQSLARYGWRFLASGGTAAALRAAGLESRDVAEYTGSPELLGGRVKTLHPAVHAGILARPDAADLAELGAHGYEPIDLVVVNLYPFEETVRRVKERAASAKEALSHGVETAPTGASSHDSGESAEAEIIEQIDIGGVALIRAAAKNHARVCVLCDPLDYERVADEVEAGGIAPATRREMAAKAFARTAAYDSAIAAWFAEAGAASEARVEGAIGAVSGASPRVTPSPAELAAFELLSPGAPFKFEGHVERELRYGENPHQKAFFVISDSRSPEGDMGALGGAALQCGKGPLGGRVLGGKELSYNNILDLDAAWNAVLSFEKCAVVIVKHLSPCGAAESDSLCAAYEAALASDPVSAFGSIVALNRPLDAETAHAIKGLFVECVAAPFFDEEAREILKSKKNLRLVEADPTLFAREAREIRHAAGGLLVQELDRGDPAGTQWRAVSERQPSEAEWEAMRFAWKVVQHVKSNAIVLGVGHATVGIGGGQTNRVDAVRQACERAGERAKGAVMASDAYFPFADNIEAAASAGVTAVVQPGGSIRDAEVLAAANRLGLAMVYTGVRHFRH